MKEMVYLKQLLEQKSKVVTTQEDLERIKIIKDFLKEDNCFLKINIESAIGILYFLGIPEDKILEYYEVLINPQNYKVPPTVRTIINK